MRQASGQSAITSLAPRRSRSAAFIVVTAWVLAAVYLVPLIDARGWMEPRALIKVTCWSITLIAVWGMWSWRRVAGTWFDPYTIFWVAAVLFNGGQALLEIFSLNEEGLLRDRFTDRVLLDSLLLVGMGLAAMHLGTLLGAVLHKASPVPDAELVPQHDAVAVIGKVFLAISFIPQLMIAVESISAVTAGGYFALYGDETGTGVMATSRVLALMFGPALLFLIAGAGGSRRTAWTAGSLVLLQGGLSLLMGVRSVSALIVVFAWIWHRTYRRLRPLYFVVGGMAMLLAFPLIAKIRNIPIEERLESDYISKEYASISNPATASISEMGGTLATIAHTVELVPEKRPFDQGASYLYAVLTLVPNLFWDVHISIARESPATWLVWTIDPWAAEKGGGYGYSFIAEAYFNFGFWGAPIALAAIGLFLGWFVTWATHGNDPARSAFVGSYISFFIIFARSESTVVVRPLIWYALVPYLGVLVLRRYMSRERASEPRV